MIARVIVWVLLLFAAIAGALTCYFVAGYAIRRASPRMTRTNVDGREVPAVLGWGIVAGALVGFAFTMWVLGLLQSTGCPSDGDACDKTRSTIPSLVAAFGLLTVGMFAAGYWDDRRGDERPRGFAGHLGALSGGAITGGIVKLVVGATVSLIAVVLLLDTGSVPRTVMMAAAIALTANLVNLLDRAPGRALKVFLAVALPLWIVGQTGWPLLAAGMIGAALLALPIDLRATAMLGDAGANPLGAVLGLGLAMNLAGSTIAVAVLVLVLLALNLASERWSFSEVIASNRWLARLDHLGRK